MQLTFNLKYTSKTTSFILKCSDRFTIFCPALFPLPSHFSLPSRRVFCVSLLQLFWGGGTAGRSVIRSKNKTFTELQLLNRLTFSCSGLCHVISGGVSTSFAFQSFLCSAGMWIYTFTCWPNLRTGVILRTLMSSICQAGGSFKCWVHP